MTGTIPMVFGTEDDPVGAGLGASLAHLGGNATGVVNFRAVKALGLTVPRSLLLRADEVIH